MRPEGNLINIAEQAKSCPNLSSEILGKASFILDKSSSEKTKVTRKSEENLNDATFEESEGLLTIEDDLILDEGEDSSELDDELLEEDDQDTVPLEEITDVASPDSEEN